MAAFCTGLQLMVEKYFINQTILSSSYNCEQQGAASAWRQLCSRP
jgi:hypothetical protein